MTDLKIYKTIFQRIKINIIYIWIIIAIFIINLVVILFNLVNYEENYQNNGIGTKEGYIKSLIAIKDIECISSKSTIVINNKKYSYQIIKIDNDIQEINSILYQAIFIKTNKRIIENQYITFTIPIKSINFYHYIKNNIRGYF